MTADPSGLERADQAVAEELDSVDHIARLIATCLDRIESDVNKRPRRMIHETRATIQTARSWAESLKRRTCPACFRAGNVLGTRCALCQGSGSVTTAQWMNAREPQP